MKGFKSRTTIFAVFLLLLSLGLHLLISWQAGLRMTPPDSEKVDEILLVVEEKTIEEIPETLPVTPDEPLDFEEEFDFERPDTLLNPKVFVPPPEDSDLALRAQGMGYQNIELTLGAGFIPISDGFGLGGFKFGMGNGLGDGSAQFAPYIARLREVGLDVVFCVDATGSMGWVLSEVKNRIEDIVRIVRALVPIARFGFVAYRDDDDPEFVTKIQNLTYSTRKLRWFLSNLKADGGGDWHEAVHIGVKDAIELSGWRVGARKLIVVIGDAPLGQVELATALNHVNRFRSGGGTVSTLDVSEQANPHLVEQKLGRKVLRSLYRGSAMEEFVAISEAGQGDNATLDGDAKLMKRLIKLIMGDQFATEMDALLDVL